jgi:hypothetical protein
MVDWLARHRAGARVTGISQWMTLFKLEFDLFATLKQRRKYEKHNDQASVHSVLVSTITHSGAKHGQRYGQW